MIVTALLLALSLLVTLDGVMVPADSHAASAQEIDIKVDGALKLFKQEVAGADAFLKSAKGILVFPQVLKAGINKYTLAIFWNLLLLQS